MDRLMQLGLLAMSGAALDRARHAARATASQAMALLVSAVLAACALGCAAAALWLAISPSVGALGAWLVVAAAFAGASVVVRLGLWLWRRARARRVLASRSLADPLGSLEGVEWPLVGVALLAGFLNARRRAR